MKTIIAGSRNITDYDRVLDAVIESRFIITEIISGRAKGPDSIGEQIGVDFNIPVTYFPADWGKYKSTAGPIRNEQMAMYGEALIAVWDGKSSGTKHMINIAKKLGLKVYVSN